MISQSHVKHKKSSTKATAARLNRWGKKLAADVAAVVKRYPDCSFTSEADLAKHIAYTAILDLLVADYAREAACARDVAEGFIREMAARVAAASHLDLDGMKQAVRTAIDIYEREIAGGCEGKE